MHQSLLYQFLVALEVHPFYKSLDGLVWISVLMKNSSMWGATCDFYNQAPVRPGTKIEKNFLSPNWLPPNVGCWTPMVMWNPKGWITVDGRCVKSIFHTVDGPEIRRSAPENIQNHCKWHEKTKLQGRLDFWTINSILSWIMHLPKPVWEGLPPFLRVRCLRATARWAADERQPQVLPVPGGPSALAAVDDARFFRKENGGCGGENINQLRKFGIWAHWGILEPITG